MPKRPAPAPNHFTAADVAADLKVTDRTVRSVAEAEGIGQRFGKAWMFTADDLERLRGVVKSGPGRPKKVATAPARR